MYKGQAAGLGSAAYASLKGDMIDLKMTGDLSNGPLLSTGDMTLGLPAIDSLL